ncbi:hypothetical protein CEE45_00390 [Candidatus Heimdallarchaeota archaeon B3_Heim]|nr:MAG: hypothetical protein CEE45_00390 [Candidatus Heimdallarchaeota archaeon B3_Heim]
MSESKGRDQHDDELQKLKDTYMLISLFSITVGNFAKLDYFRMFEGFDRLEQLTDSLPIISIPDSIPEEHKRPLLIYRLKKNQPKLSDLTTLIRSAVSITDLGRKLWLNSTNNLIQSYLDYFELVFENLVEPIVKQLGPEVPKYHYKHSYQFQINWVQQWFKKHNLDQSLGLFIEKLNGYLRNAFVHNIYYVTKESIIYFAYNPKTKELKECVLSLKDFGNDIAIIMLSKLAFYVVCGLRFLEVTPEELRENLKRKEEEN